MSDYDKRVIMGFSWDQEDEIQKVESGLVQ